MVPPYKQNLGVFVPWWHWYRLGVYVCVCVCVRILGMPQNYTDNVSNNEIMFLFSVVNCGPPVPPLVTEALISREIISAEYNLFCIFISLFLNPRTSWGYAWQFIWKWLFVSCGLYQRHYTDRLPCGSSYSRGQICRYPSTNKEEPNLKLPKVIWFPSLIIAFVLKKNVLIF